MFTPRYCTTCGALLGRSKAKLMGYDSHSGKPHYQVTLRCPNWRFWSLGHSMVTMTDDPHRKTQMGEGD